MDDARPRAGMTALADRKEPSTLGARTGRERGLWLRAMGPRRRLWTTCAFCVGASLLACAFFWPVVALHRILVPADVLYLHDPLWTHLAPVGFTRPANPLDSDALTEFYPWTLLAAQALHSGIVPLWDPYSFAGTPFLASMQTAVFYPVNLLLYLLVPPPNVLGVRAIVHLTIVLTGTALFARRYGLSYPAAILTAVAFGLGLPYIVWLEHPIGGAVAWLPWILLGAHALAGPRHFWPVIGTALAVDIDILAGQGESTAHILLFCTGYTAMAAWQNEHTPRAVAAALLRFIAAVALGCALSAIHLLPVAAQLPLSEAAVDRAAQARMAPVGLLGDPTRWPSFVVALVPDFFGNPTWRTLLPHVDDYNEAALYIGTIPLFLAATAVRFRRDRWTIFFGLSALLAIGVALDLPVLGTLNGLPLLRVAANGRLRIEYAFAMAMLAGIGLDTLRERGIGRAVMATSTVWLLIIVALATIGVVSLLPLQGVSPTMALHAAVPIAWSLLLWLMLRIARRSSGMMRMLPGFLVSATIIDLFSLGTGYHTAVDGASLQVVPPAIAAVQRDHGLYRVAGLGSALLPALSSNYGLQDIRGYDPAFDANYEDFFSPLFNAPKGMRLGLAPFGPSPKAARALNLLGVRYLFAACSVPVNERYYQPVYRGDGCVYRNPAALPRLWLVHSARGVTPEQSLALLGSGTVDPRTVALVAPAAARSAAWAPLTRVAAGAGKRPYGAVHLVHYGLNAVDATVTTVSPAALLLSDAYAPGWTATVDGRPASLARADAVIRAVPIPAGSHHITFSYRPAAYTVGMALSASTATLMLAACVVALWRRARDPASGTLLAP